MLALYCYNNSICTQKVFITLALKQLDCEMRQVDLFRNEQFSPAYLRINPKGVVPALDHDGRIVIESTLICEYLDECFAQTPLMPADPWLRARMRLWSKAVDEQLFEATRELSFSAMFRERMRALSDEAREARFRNTGDVIKRDRLMSTYALGIASPYVLQGIGSWETCFAHMEEDLADGRAWLLGEALSLADIGLMPFVARLAALELLAVFTVDRPAVQAWWQRTQALPAFRAGVADRISEAEYASMKASGSALQARVAERRAEYLEFARGRAQA
jgi:glutathione S-transferase